MSIDAHYRLETTEQVELDFELAGPGSRLCAWVIDALLISLAVLGLFLVLTVLGMGALATGWFGAGRGWGGMALALLITLVFVVTTFYHVFFEAVMRGQTPGKRQLKLRAIREEGVGMSFTDVLVRNLLRIVDFMPLFYLVGGLVCLLHPMHKRLGDLAAGTIVVKEGEPDYRAASDQRRREGPADAEAEPAEAAATVPLAAGERQLVERFLKRRGELTLEARSSLAERVARPLYGRYGGHWDHAESYLERLAEGRQDEP